MGPHSPRACGSRVWPLLTAGLVLAGASGLSGQTVVSGTVVDSLSGSPVAGAVVFGEISGLRATTDTAGMFRLTGVDVPTVLSISAFGYLGREIEGVGTEPVTIRLVRSPIRLDPLDVAVTRFEARLDSIHTLLDRSAKGSRWPAIPLSGVPLIATREDLARYDEANDGEIALAALGLFPSFDFECGWIGGARGSRPTLVFIDGEERPELGCQIYREMDVSSICRLELVPIGKLYVWSCPFLARLADGDESIPRMMELLIPPWWSGR